MTISRHNLDGSGVSLAWAVTVKQCVACNHHFGCESCFGPQDAISTNAEPERE